MRKQICGMENIFVLFGTTAEMARALGEGYQTVASWRRRGSIPAKHDKKIISAAKRRGKRLTYEDLAEARCGRGKNGWN